MKEETLEQLMARLDELHKDEAEWAWGNGSFNEWPRISEALREMREFIETASTRAYMDELDSHVVSEFLARLDKPERKP